MTDNPLEGTFLGNLTLRIANLTNDSGDFRMPVLVEKSPFNDEWQRANIITSDRKDGGHALLLDLDVPHWYAPSSTPGHGHLIVDLRLDQHQWEKTMELLAEIGLLEQGYVRASLARGYASLRLPWIQKVTKNINGWVEKLVTLR